MHPRDLHNDLEDVLGDHLPETSRAEDMASALVTVVEMMVDAHAADDLDSVLDKIDEMQEDG